MGETATLTWNSVNPNPLRPVAVTVGVMCMPLATNVPPLPGETPLRISQVAPVMLVFNSCQRKLRLYRIRGRKSR